MNTIHYEIFRFALNVKGLAYKTIWLEYLDIETTCKKIGAAKTNSSAIAYTLPIIHDPAHDAVVSDSIEIARYLDKTYPETSTLFPPGSYALQEAFQVAHEKTAAEAMYLIMLPLSHAKLNTVSQAYFRRTREAIYGMKLEEFSPLGPKRDLHWKNLKEIYAVMADWLAKGEPGPFMMGDKISYADVTIAGFIMWMRTTFGSESAEWKDILTWQDGTWANYMKEFEKYEQVK